MKKSFFIVITSLLTVAFLACVFDIQDNSDNNSSKKTKVSDSSIEENLPCSISGKVIFTNSTDSSSIQVYLDKNYGLFTQSVLNKIFPENPLYASSSQARNIVSYSNCSSDGTYRFENLESGTYTIYAISSDSTEKAVCKSVTVSSGSTVQIPDMVLTATGSVSGKIILDDSLDNNIGFIVSAAGTSFFATTASDGQFTITGIPAGSGYQIVVIKGSYAHLWQSDITVKPLEDTFIGDFNIQSSELLNPELAAARDVIHYELNGGILPEDAPLIYTYGTTVTLLEPSKPGYGFLGFYLNSDFSGKIVTSLNSDYVIGQKLYAKALYGKKVAFYFNM